MAVEVYKKEHRHPACGHLAFRYYVTADAIKHGIAEGYYFSRSCNHSLAYVYTFVKNEIAAEDLYDKPRWQ